jgi:hypothetical protein
MGEGTNIALMEKIVANQRQIIEEETGKPAKETPQVWALYKEVLDYYEAGMRVPDDVIMLLCDDNWGNVRRLPRGEERNHSGGWGMYYHVDYVGGPRNSKWINVTPIQNMWEQMTLTYNYGVNALWILNVGDLKPMEYPISLFLDLAWNPDAITLDNLLDHTKQYCAQQFGEENAQEAARILNLYCKYAGRVTPELLDRNTYNLATGEFKQAVDEFTTLEHDALRLYAKLAPQYLDAYQELLLFPIQAFSNLYEMYYAQAMNHALYQAGDVKANDWADRVEACFARDAELCRAYNKTIAGGKWDGMMTQKHIGYKSWQDNFEKDTLPEIFRIDAPAATAGGYVFEPSNGYIAIEAEHYYSATDGNSAAWTVIPYMGRTLSGLAVMPYTKPTDGASVTYRMKLPEGVTEAKVIVVTKSNLAFENPKGHCFRIGFGVNKPKRINTNKTLLESGDNVYTVFYPTVARRVIQKEAKIPTAAPDADGYVNLTITPADPGIVFEKIIVDLGGYQKSYLFMQESPYTKQ